MALKERYEAACSLLLHDIRPILSWFFPIPELRDIARDYVDKEFEFENALYGITRDVNLAKYIAVYVLADERPSVQSWRTGALEYFERRSPVRWGSVSKDMEDILRWSAGHSKCSRIWCFYDGCRCSQPLVDR